MTRAGVKYAMQEIVANKNLYFHFRYREQIVLYLFMYVFCEDITRIWENDT